MTVQGAYDPRPMVQKIAIAMLFTAVLYSLGVLAHRAFEFDHAVNGADAKMGQVRSGHRTTTARRPVLRREIPSDPPSDLKSELSDVISRAAVHLPEEDMLWMVQQIYALNRAHSGAAKLADTSP